MKLQLFGCVVLASASFAQVPPSRLQPTGDTTRLPGSARIFDCVLHDDPGDGRLWACGDGWKASFGREGFVYVPRLPGAPRNMPLHFRVTSLRVGGEAMPFATDAKPAREGDRITFDRGILREVYDLGLRDVEQSFLVDASLPGDLVLELSLATELVEDVARPGLQFACEFGEVTYGDAFVVRDAGKVAIPCEWNGRSLQLRVPAAERDNGAVVIDPILSTQPASGSVAAFDPDVAYDATHHRYLVVWEAEWSVTDHDVWTEMFDGVGNRLIGSVAAIDMSSTHYVAPRTANLDDGDRFLVAAEVVDPLFGFRRMIWCRTRNAYTSMSMNIPRLLSDPALPGDNTGPEVGADSATGPGDHDWLVVWTNATSGVDANVHGRMVLGSGQPSGASTIVVADDSDVRNHDAQVSRGNGNGQVPHPMWCVVYTRHVEQWTGHVLGRTIGLDGGVGPEIPFDQTTWHNVHPQVSSPVDAGDATVFLCTYERENPSLAARAVVARFAPSWQSSHPVDLTALFGVIGRSLRVESDGARFVVVSAGPTAGDLQCRTLAWNGVLLGLHDGPATLYGSSSMPEIAACRNSGGPAAKYGITWLHHGANGVTPIFARYAGHVPGVSPWRLPTACDGLGIDGAGASVIGGVMNFVVTDFGADLPLFVFGGAAADPIAICSDCALGVRPDLLIHLQIGFVWNLPISPDPDLLGAVLAVQGVGIGASACLGGFRFSDTIQFQIQ